MLFIYALAAAVSFAVVWVLKLIFMGVQKQKARAQARIDARAEKAAGSADAAPERGE